MNVPTAVHIVVAERLNDGVVIQFSDGRVAFYCTALLSAMLSQAAELKETEITW